MKDTSRNAVQADAPLLTDYPAPGVARLTLNRPAQRNSLSRELMQRMTEALNELAADAGVRVILLGAQGPAFCAGHDLREITGARSEDDQGRAFFEATMAECSTLMQTIVETPKPVIARVHATATAAGCQLVASCDLAVAGRAAHFATPGVNIGLFCSTPMVALARNVGRKHAMEMLLTGEPIDADRAAAMGLVNRAVADDELDQAVMALAETIAGKSGRTLAIGKAAFYRQLEMPLADAYAYASEVMVHNMLTADAEEGIGAFLDKRSPTWTHQ